MAMQKLIELEQALDAAAEELKAAVMKIDGDTEDKRRASAYLHEIERLKRVYGSEAARESFRRVPAPQKQAMQTADDPRPTVAKIAHEFAQAIKLHELVERGYERSNDDGGILTDLVMDIVQDERLRPAVAGYGRELCRNLTADHVDAIAGVSAAAELKEGIECLKK
jgi:hypothetical protein